MTTPDIHSGQAMARENLQGMLDAVADHFAIHALPAAFSVSVHPSLEEITVHLYSTEGPAAVADDLLAWAATLTETSASGWRRRDAATVHLYVHGRLASGAPIDVYGAVPYTAEIFGPDVAPGQQKTLPLAVVHVLAQIGRATA